MQVVHLSNCNFLTLKQAENQNPRTSIMEKSIEFSNAFEETLKASDIGDLVTEYSEIGLDSLLNGGILENVPIFKTFVCVGKIGITVSDMILAKKLMDFLTALNELPAAKRQKMVEKLESDPKYERKVGEHLIELLDRIDSHLNTKMLAKVFIAYANREIDALMLQRLNLAIERLPNFEIGTVRKFRNSEKDVRKQMDEGTLHNLINAGLAKERQSYGGGVYVPTELMEIFLQLNLDIN